MLFWACGNKRDTFQAEPVSINVERFEQDLFSADTQNVNQWMAQLDQKYPNWLRLYFEGIMKFGQLEDPAILPIIKDYSTNQYLLELKEDCDSVFGAFAEEQKALELAFGNFKHYFPETSTPRVITFVAGFNNQIVIGDSLVGIGLDMFLGPNYKYYQTTNIPRYIIAKLDKKFLPVNTMKGVIESEFPSPSEENFTHKMIIEGKRMVILDYLFPNTPDSIKIGYSEEQMEYCLLNEGKIWSFFIENNLLYSNLNADMAKYFNDAPFTVTLSPNSSPKLGVFIGWQIVKKYLEKNPDITLQELMEENDYQKIMQVANYKPRI